MELNVELLRTSFGAVVEREPEVTRRFYEHLFERYPDLRRLFTRNQPRAQERMLAEALAAVLEHLEDAPWLARELGALGGKHEGYGVTPEMYDAVGECLLVTLAEVAGESWTPAVAQSWAAAFGAIRDLMLAGAGRAAVAEGAC